ncbi:MAG: hypothetical protein M3O61_12085 [Gemmatimonadota bacterium]|nr:hypothetical protein [Gemmatimonadota bacterium]
MKTKTFLSPAAPGKQGEVYAIQYDEAPRQFLEPVPYSQTLANLVAQTVAETAKVTGKKTKRSFDDFLADLDERLAKRAMALGPTTALNPAAATTAAHSATCCSGKYLCPKCQVAA